VVRKRKPGGGRKPKLGTAMRSKLTVRMPDDLRDQLEAAALKRDRGLSDELHARLRLSFDKERERKRDPATRHLCNLVAVIARQVQFMAKPKSTSKEWQQDPFTFRTFKIAVAKVLDTLEPPGKIPPPTIVAPGIPEPFEDPETVAQFVANKVLRNLLNARLRTKEERAAKVRDLVRFIEGDREPSWPGSAEEARLSDSISEFIETEESITYLLEQARAYLKPTPKKRADR